MGHLEELNRHKFILSLVFLTTALACSFLLGTTASAINGANTNVFPDTTYPAGGAPTYAVVQLRSGGAQVKARSTVANIYVPTSMQGQNIQLAIVNGCNNSGPDINGSVANTAFYIDYPTLQGQVSTATDCIGGNITMNFTAVASRQVSDGTGTYNVYRFKADAYGSELVQYLNAFQVWGVPAGIYLGPSDMPPACDIGSYPRSCPTPRPGSGASLVYSSYYNRGSPFGAPYGQRVEVTTGPCVTNGRISLYDLDANDTGLNQNLSMEIRANGQVLLSLNHAQISGWELAQDGAGNFINLGYGGNEDQYMDFPTNGTFELLPNTNYELIVTGLSYNNAMQAAILTFEGTSCEVPGCRDPVALNYNPAATVDGEACRYPVPGCTNPAAPNFNPAATVDDGSCDFCENISGAQGVVPPGLVQDGPNCVFPAPTCIPGAAIIAFTGQEFTTSITLRNNSSVTLDVINISYAGPSSISGIANTGNPDVGPSPASISSSGNSIRNNPVSGTITWTITYGQTASILGNGTVTCTQPILIRNRPPVCRVLPIDPLSPQVGEPFRTRVIITNPNPNEINLTSAGYQLQNIPNDSRNTNTSGQATASVPQSLAPGVDGTQLESAQDIRVYRQALGFDVLWTIVAEDADPGTCTRAGNNESLFDIKLLPPVCVVGRKDIVVGVPFDISVSLTNPNDFVSLELRNSGEEYVISNGRRGDADPAGGWDPASGFTTYIMNQEVSLTSVASDLTVDIAGDYSINWSVDSEAGLAVGDCADIGAPGSPGGPGGGGDDGGGPGDPTLSAYTQPYVRFYGNDVFAGGNYGSTCTQSGDPQARGNGFFSGATSTHATYRGAASELAIFALDQITGVLSGSQDVNRTALNSLSFANLGGGAGSSVFGGDFASPLCADDYWAFRPDESDDFAVLPPSGTALPRIDLATMPSGVFTYDGDVHVFASSPIVDGRRITLYVAGTTWIGDSNYSGAGGQSISYDTSDAWATINDIPFVRIITKGNIQIDNNIDSLDGLYVAIPDENPSAVQPTGEIYTCGLSDQLQSLGNPATSDTLVNCDRKLTVTGAFMAKRVHLLRTRGNVGSAPVAPELYDSANTAEVFRFSPELYLAMISGGYSSAVGQFDSIKTLPPAL